jgi:hypothetical protein
MQTLSRREEADILERGKKDALKACDAIVQGEESLAIIERTASRGLLFSSDKISNLAEFADCARGRTVSVLWACNGKLNTMKGCMRD